MPESPSNGGDKIPKEFFCPISSQFMKEPVIDPSTQQTFDRQSLLNNNNKNGHETVNADHDLREKITEWRVKHSLAPTFAFISTPAQLVAAVKSLLNPKQISQMKDSELLEWLRQLKSAIQYRFSVIMSKDGVLTLCRLIAGCPFPTCHKFLAEWVKLSVGILSHAHYIHQINFHEIQTEMLTLIDKACSKIINDPAFQSGLVNLIYSIWTDNNKKQIIGCRGIIQSLLSEHSCNNPSYFPEMRFDKLFLIITDLSNSDNACSENSRLIQALTSLVWPMHGKLNENQYLYLLETISSTLDAQHEDSSTVRAMTRAGLVVQIFYVLDYTILEEGEIQNTFTDDNVRDQILKMSFEILCSLSLSRIGRLEIVRVVRASGYTYLNYFSSALPDNTEDTHTNYILPVLGIISNILENARYTPMIENITDSGLIHSLIRLLPNINPEVHDLTVRILSFYNHIRSGENRYRPRDY